MTEFAWKDRDAFTEAEYAAVRARVLSEIRQRRRHAWMAYAATAAAVVVMTGALWAWRTSRVAPMPLVAHVTPPAPPATMQPTTPTALVRHAVRARHSAVRPAPAPPPAAEPLLVKLETPDPDVVIYWIVESKGDTE